mgnify:CR=1 FL=1
MHPVCKRIREQILYVSHVSGHGHIPTCFSVVEVLYAVYSVMKHNPANPLWEGRDLFVLSKGHAALAYYCILAEFGYLNKEELVTFGSYQSRLGCHADRLKVPGVEVSTGSLGHGFPVAVGMALAQKILKSERRVFVLIGDGESNEGTVWESLMVASHNKLNNLTIIFDYNKSQERSLPIRQPYNKFISFGCEVIEVDGHEVDSLKLSLEKCSSDKVKLIIANTIKGYGCKTLIDNMFEWHRKSPDADQYKKLLEELNAQAI